MLTAAPRRRSTSRLGSFLAVAGLTTALGATGVLVAARRTVDTVQRVPAVEQVLSAPSGTVENYLLVGSDSRAEGDPNTGQTGDVTGSRSDTIMVLRTDPTGGPAALLSIPRDLYVNVPGRDGKTRINSAYNEGPSVLVQTVQQELGIPIHHFVEIDFSGFKDLVDALGGVQVCFLFPTRDLNTGLDIAAPGCYLLNGVQSLSYARSRHFEEFRDGEWREDPTSDLGRIKRQQDFVNRALQGAIDRIKVNPFAAGDLATAIGSALAVDESLDPIKAAASLRTAVSGGLQTYSLPVEGKTIDDKAVLILGDGADAVLDYFRGTSSTPPPIGS